MHTPDKPAARWGHRRLILRCIPGLTWLQLCPTRGAEPGHHWQYRGLIRRDTFTVRGWGLVVLAMPKRARLRPPLDFS